MKNILLTISLLAIVAGLYAQERVDTVKCSLIVNGRFFNGLTISQFFEQMSGGSTVLLRAADKQRIFAYLVGPDFEIPASMLAYEVPFENVQNGKEFAEQYNEKVVWQTLISQKAKEGRVLKVGMKLDEFSLKDYDGNVWDNNRIKGKVTVVNVWYSGCGPCLKEMPIISEWKMDFPDVNFLSVDYESKEKMKAVTDRRNFTWTHLYGDTYFTSWIMTNSQDTGFPLTIVLDKDGIVRHVAHGTNDEIRAAIIESIRSLKQ